MKVTNRNGADTMTSNAFMSRASWRINAATLAIACIALFAAVGGPSYAAGVVGLKKNAVKSKHIAKGAVKSSELANNGVKSEDLQDGGIGVSDLSAAAKAALEGIADGSITTAKLADGAVTTPKLGDAAVDSAKIADDSVTGFDVHSNTLSGDDLGANSVRASELASNSVDSDEIVNGGLNGVDIGVASGVESINFPNIVAGDCEYMAPVVPEAHESDQVTVSPEAGFNPDSTPIVFYGMAPSTDGFIRVVACNIGGAPIDLGPVDFHYTVIDN